MTITMTAPTATLTSMGTRRAFLGGARAMLPWLAGVVPFGLTVGVTIADSSVDPLAGWATGPLVYAGSAQLAAIELLDGGAGIAVVVITVLIINARLLVYSGSMAPSWAGSSRGFRSFAAYLLIDPSYAVGTDGYRTHTTRRAGHAHYLGCGVTLWVAWQAAIGIGILAGGAVPEISLFSLVVPYYLIAEVIRSTESRPARAAAAVGAVVALAAHGVPMHAGAVIAIALGVAAAGFVEVRTP
jgi:predicted branched-subunit amino acid permease